MKIWEDGHFTQTAEAVMIWTMIIAAFIAIVLAPTPAERQAASMISEIDSKIEK